jgi:hypothetical protein
MLLIQAHFRVEWEVYTLHTHKLRMHNNFDRRLKLLEAREMWLK